MALNSKPGEINSGIIDFHLKGIDDKLYSLNDFTNKKIIVLIFMCNHCPYVKAVMPRFVTLQKTFSDISVQFIGINSNDTIAYPEDSFKNMKLFAKEYSLNFPYLLDETQETARKYDAVCTPDIYVYDETRKLKYRGRLDDNWKDETKVTSKDLESAIRLLAEGKEINIEQKPSMGCSIKWK